ncbi:MAG: AAA-like domain-containing protein [Coleofasciculus sp. C1-SOL-03]|uniref:AAA-like domain-containing protein n=1 Tax=Coleofasciculus sp. C1-SOL-03 TaxID=3069522 RepID=UPI003300EB02
MARPNYGPQAKKRAKRLLEALLAYANDELENTEHLRIKVNWQSEKQLVVRTKVRFLQELTSLDPYEGKLNSEQIKEALKRLADFVEILEDNRPGKKGLHDWHFTLKLWHKRYDKEAIMQRFNLEWERRRPEKSKQVAPSTSTPHSVTTGVQPKENRRNVETCHGASLVTSGSNVETYCDTSRQIYRSSPPLANGLELPNSPVELNSQFYIERPPIEERCYQTIRQAGALIRIKAPRQMGKTSLLDRILDYAEQQGYATVRLNLLQAEADVFSSLNRFLRWLCVGISSKLKLDAQLDEYWDQDRGSIVNCTTYIQDHLLEQLNSSLVLALDEADRVFQSPDIAQGFFPMLRSWHEEAKTVDIWEELRLVVAHSTEDYGPLDINQSPFNVGLPIELPEFTSQQVADLAQRYQLDWDETQVLQLMAMVGGHPYLVRLGLYHLARQDVTLSKLLQDAPTEAGIYEAHLRRHWGMLRENAELAAALKQVVSATEPVRIETMQAYQLYSMGLIQRKRDRVVPRCQLYRQYFQRIMNYEL